MMSGAQIGSRNSLWWCKVVGGLLLTSLVVPVWGDVRSLDNNDLTETYIKDSTIIVAPKKKKGDEHAEVKKLMNLTISPGEPIRTAKDDMEEVATAQSELDERGEAVRAGSDEERRRLLQAMGVDTLRGAGPQIPVSQQPGNREVFTINVQSQLLPPEPGFR